MTYSKTILGMGLALAILVPLSASPALAIPFGDNSSQWANDGECDDPRFAGSGMASILLDEDTAHDADDCRTLYNKGQITVVGEDNITSTIDFGNDTSSWANDKECDDPRFSGPGMAGVLLDDDIGRDASDCRALLQQGQISFTGQGKATSQQNINFGSNSSQWANDGECDDPRFEGQGMASILQDQDTARDANDCRALYNNGQIVLVGQGNVTSTIDYGNDTSTWANDGECDDPRFSGPGSATTLLDDDIGRDASDCRALLQQGQISFTGQGKATSTSQNVTACPANALGLQQSLTCKCSAEAASNGTRMWGTNIYTSDSYICRAAVHAGQISTNGGIVTLFPYPAQNSYQGSTRNGVTTNDWGSYGESFRF